MMIHCGDPIHYSSISTSYWQQHFLCFGKKEEEEDDQPEGLETGDLETVEDDEELEDDDCWLKGASEDGSETYMIKKGRLSLKLV